jgi:Spy/CpxP family protein refolding chaperone
MAILLLVMAFGITGAIAQPMGQNEGMQDDPPMGGDMMCGKMGGGMMHDGMMGEHHIRMILMQLGLDDKQKEQIEGIITRTKKDMIKKNADLKIAQIDLENILSKDPVDMKAAESKFRAIEAIKTDLMLVHLNAVQEGKSILTPEQRAKMKEIMHKHMMDGGCNCEKMKGEMMKEKEHHDQEKMMMK